MGGIITRSVRGCVTLSGGTRNVVKAHRPWQPKLVFPSESNPCPFCTRAQNDEYVPEAGWKTFQNFYTPFPYHRLLIPSNCWDETKLRNLGGEQLLLAALRVAIAELRRTREHICPTWVYAHVGYGAGQNLTHLHWHLCGAPTAPQAAFADDAESVLLNSSAHFNITLCGVRAGQTIVRPNDEENICLVDVLGNDELFREFVFQAYWVVDIFNRRLHYPDYCLFLALNGEPDIHFRYTPILNNWGGSEFAAVDYGTPFVMPWPHSATKEYLLQQEM